VHQVFGKKLLNEGLLESSVHKLSKLRKERATIFAFSNQFLE
jgi:hypothetical protein